MMTYMQQLIDTKLCVEKNQQILKQYKYKRYL